MWIGCAAKRRPVRAAKPGRSEATVRLTLVTSMQAAACRATFVVWYQVGDRPAARWFSLKLVKQDS